VPKLRVHNFSISLDGYAAGPDQDLANPLGVGGPALHHWVLATRYGRQMMGEEGGTAGIDDEFGSAGDVGIGATIIGRNMFGPVRGPWEDDEWKGWWGEEPPYHHQVFVLTHHARPPVTMEGGTTFNFVVDGIESAREQALAAAAGADVRVGGGASTIQQYLRAGLLDELHLAIVPTFLGAGERLFDHLDGGPHGYECLEVVTSPGATHVRIAKR
jgi:dihydrofolate reductase